MHACLEENAYLLKARDSLALDSRLLSTAKELQTRRKTQNSARTQQNILEDMAHW